MIYTKTRKVKSPSRGTQFSAGIDFYIPDEFNELSVNPGESCLIPSGLKVEFDENHALIAFNKSGVATKKGLVVGACVVDYDYEGELHLHVMNVSNSPVLIKGGEKIVQFVLVPVSYAAPIEVEEDKLTKNRSSRGIGGFGSTGV